MADNSVETLVPGLLTREWLADGRVVVYMLQRLGTGVVDAWADAVAASLQTWPAGQPYLAIHDFSNVPLTLIERQVKNIYTAQVWPVGRLELPPPLPMPVRLALVMSFSLSARFARVTAREAATTEVHKVFFKREPAVEWLLGTELGS